MNVGVQEVLPFTVIYVMFVSTAGTTLKIPTEMTDIFSSLVVLLARIVKKRHIQSNHDMLVERT